MADKRKTSGCPITKRRDVMPKKIEMLVLIYA